MVSDEAAEAGKTVGPERQPVVPSRIKGSEDCITRFTWAVQIPVGFIAWSFGYENEKVSWRWRHFGLALDLLEEQTSQR